jgi:hypothetical protein
LTLLTLAALMFLRSRTVYSAAFYVAAILFGFPLGSLLERAFEGAPTSPLMLLYVSALLSYAAAGAVIYLVRGTILAPRPA